MKTEMQQRMEQSKPDYKKLADEARIPASLRIPRTTIDKLADAIDALVAERDKWQTRAIETMEAGLHGMDKRTDLLAKLVIATEALKFYANHQNYGWQLCDCRPYGYEPIKDDAGAKAHIALEKIKETDNAK